MKHTAERCRIEALPRRVLNIERSDLALKWTSILRKREIPSQCDCKTRYGRTCIYTLLNLQGIILEEAARYGAIAFASVGSGKTGISLLLPMVIPGVKCVVLLVPKPILSQLVTVDYPRWARHWELPTLSGLHTPQLNRPVLHIIPYSMLSTSKATDLLQNITPDLIIADEAHNLANTQNCARTARLRTYINENPKTKFIPMSGSFVKTGIKDFYHLADWALRSKSPVPRFHVTALEWDTRLYPAFTQPGAPKVSLSGLIDGIRDEHLAFKTRFLETPGVVVASGEGLNSELQIVDRRLDLPSELKAVIKEVNETWVRPDGESLLPSNGDEDGVGNELDEAMTVAMCVRQLHAGFYTRWVFNRGEPSSLITAWKYARKAWHSKVREQLAKGITHLDSAKLLGIAALRWHEGFEYKGIRHPPHTPHPLAWNCPEYIEWVAIKDKVKPITDAVWLSDFMIRDAIAWGKAHKGIIWFVNPAVGKRIAMQGNFLYFGRGPEASATILKERGDRTIVASILAHGEGKNLELFSKALVTQIPSSRVRWEQLLGRLHRIGQIADTVVFCVYKYGVLQKAYDAAVAKAEAFRLNSGLNDKLLFAV
jgi:hypothetical protein